MRRRSGIGVAALVVAMFALAVPARAGDATPSAIERQFVGMLNAERSAQGLTPVEISPALTEIADDYVAYNDQVGGIDHARDAPYTQRANDAGCTKWSGPVLAEGYPTPRDALDAWLNSPGHRAVLLDPEITHIGPGFKNQHALAFGMPCAANGLHDSGDFGDPNATDPVAGTLSLDDPRVRGQRIKVLARIDTGSVSAKLTAKRRGKTHSGSARIVDAAGAPTKLKVKVSRAGRWRLSVNAGDRSYRLGKVRVG